MFTLCDLYAFQAGFDFLLDSVWRHHLVKHNPQLSVTIQPAGWAHLQHGAFNMASLRKKQLVGNDQGLAYDGFDRLTLLCRCRIQRCNQQSMDDAARWRRIPDRGKRLGPQWLRSEVERSL